MESRLVVFSTTTPLQFCRQPTLKSHHQLAPGRLLANVSPSGYQSYELKKQRGRKNCSVLCAKAVLSEQRQYPRIGANSTGPIPPSQLIQVVETAAKTGAEVVMDAVNKPRNISYKGLTDLVTEEGVHTPGMVLVYDAKYDEFDMRMIVTD